MAEIKRELDEFKQFDNFDLTELEIDKLLNSVNTTMEINKSGIEQFTDTLDTLNVHDPFLGFTEEFLDTFSQCKTLPNPDDIPVEFSKKKKSRSSSLEMLSSIIEPEIKRKPKDKKCEVLNKSLPSSLSNEYYDFSNLTDEEVSDMFFLNNKCNSKAVFPMKLHTIIERSEEDGYSSIISWQSHGRAFKIHDRKVFFDYIISRFFYQSNIQSFFRQLKIYGFQRIVGTGNQDKDAYFHELFLKGRPGLCSKIIRFNGRQVNEPNFSNMPPILVVTDESEASLSQFQGGNAASSGTNCLRAIHYMTPSNQLHQNKVVETTLISKISPTNNTGTDRNFVRKLSSNNNLLHPMTSQTLSRTYTNDSSTAIHSRSSKEQIEKFDSRICIDEDISEIQVTMETTSTNSSSLLSNQPSLGTRKKISATSSASQTKEYSFLKPYSNAVQYIVRRGGFYFNG